MLISYKKCCVGRILAPHARIGAEVHLPASNPFDLHLEGLFHILTKCVICTGERYAPRTLYNTPIHVFSETQ